ncbi:MAG: hypothetical protein WB797_10745 [Nocardioides sp.]
MNTVDGFAFARLFRNRCSACGSDRLTWGSLEEVDGQLDAGEAASDWLGLGSGPGLMEFVAWRCGDCGELGIFGPVEAGP